MNRALLLLLAPTSMSALTLAGYTFTTSMGATWAGMDTYLAGMSNASRHQDWAATLAFYQSVDPLTSVSLSQLPALMNPAHPYAMLTGSYWPGQTSHGDTLVRQAIGGTGAVLDWNDKSRRELLTKAAAYEVVRQYVMNRVESGVAKCNAGASGAVDDWEVA